MISIKESFGLADKKKFGSFMETARGAMSALLNGKGAGVEMTGWLTYGRYMQDDELSRIEKTGERLAKQSDIIVSIGIGGSYLGIRAMTDIFPGNGKIVYAGNNLSSVYLNQLLQKIEGKNFSLIVISKSGTTTEPSLLFRIMFKKLLDKYGEGGIKERVVLVTDKIKGALQKIREKYGCDHYIVPDDIGGRFSIFTPVGLVPFAAAGLDIRAIANGVNTALDAFKNNREDNPVIRYAVLRNMYYSSGVTNEILISYEEQMRNVIEWWKQLFGESEGKESKGLFPCGAIFTTDLHSFGQYLQQGPASFFETILHIVKDPFEFPVPVFSDDFDGFNVTAGKTIGYVRDIAYKATSIAHTDGGRPILILEIPELTPVTISELFIFFMLAVSISGYLLGLNPFDQPGVELYKKNMLTLLGKYGENETKKDLEARISTGF